MTGRRRATGLGRTGAVLGVVLFAASLFVHPASGSDVTGTAGVDTALPDTDSAVTVRGRGEFADLEIKVNQTRNLLNQAVSVTWRGAAPTIEANGGLFGANYLQIMQCWGDPDGSNPANPGPPPEQCAFGAKNAQAGGVSGNGFPGTSFATERIMSRRGWALFEGIAAETGGTVDPVTGNLWRDFVAVDGTRIGSHIDPHFNPSLEGGVYWQNPYFNLVTSNEIAGARTLDNGAGSEFFEVVTGVENSGLGCGQRVQPAGDGDKKVPRCWIVIVPRSDALSENAGTPFEDVNFGIVTSPLAPKQWEHRIAVEIEFNPVDTPCELGEDSRRIVGNELVLPAVISWQPKLCATEGLSAYSYGTVSDAGARQQMIANVPGSAGMYVVSRPLDEQLDDPANPTVYAPLAASGVVVGFNLERSPSSDADDAAKRLRGVRIATLDLTPRLLAKLLTQSYARQINIKRLPSDEWEAANEPYDYGWLEGNPDHLGEDKDFLRFNPEFEELEVVWRKEFSAPLAPAGNSDFARQLWEYVLADPEAKAWLDGEPDQWGMRVNPVYATTAEANVLGVPFADEAPASFPKSDPYCYQAPETAQGVKPPLLCGTDWNPYTQSLRDGARLARAATDGARLQENGFATTPDRYYSRTPPQPIDRTMLTLTDTPSASLFGLQSARLSRAGDNGDDREFIAPDADGIAAALKAMVTSGDDAVTIPNPSADAPGAYPLTVLSYAAIRPLNLDEDARDAYAAFVEYAAGDGQVSGPRFGELPVGYAPLSEELRAQATTAAALIRTLEAEPEEPAEEPASSQQPGAPTATVPTPPDGAAAPPQAFTPSASPPRRATTSATSTARSPAATSGEVAPSSSTVPSTEDDAPRSVQLARTPGVPVPASRFAFVLLGCLAAFAGLAALEITKRPRRSVVAPPPPPPNTSHATEAKT